MSEYIRFMYVIDIDYIDIHIDIDDTCVAWSTCGTTSRGSMGCSKALGRCWKFIFTRLPCPALTLY